MKIESTELQEYINTSITAIKNGVEGTGYRIVEPIKFDLAVTNTAEGGGGLKIYVAKAEGKLKSEEINHIKFEAQPIPEPANILLDALDPIDSAKKLRLYGHT